ncbi:MAG: HAD family hydrolase [Bacilli bacterium]
MKTFDLFLFDIDGTMLDTTEMNVLPLIELIQDRTGRTLTFDEVKAYMGMTGRRILEHIGVPSNDEWYDDWVARIHRSGLEPKPYVKVLEVMRELHARGAQIGIVSSKTRAQYLLDVAPHQMDQLFDAIILAEDTDDHKPHPAPILAALKLTKVAPERAIYIGDAHTDELSCEAAGVAFALARWGAHDESPFQTTLRLTHPEDLLKLYQ